MSLRGLYDYDYVYYVHVYLLVFSCCSVSVSQQQEQLTDLYYDDDHNFTDSENSSSSAATTVTPASSPVPLPLPSAEPLPLTGLLPTPPAEVARLCPCDEQRDLCDVNCCCDAHCSAELPLFTGCSTPRVSGSSKMCSQQVAYYSLGSTVEGLSELHTALQKELNYDVFCIQSQNRVEGLSHPPPAVPSARNFDGLFRRAADYIHGSEREAGAAVSAGEASAGYLFGDVVAAVGEEGERRAMRLPAPGVTTHCVDMNPVAFLQQQSARCSRSLELLRDCSSLLALSLHTYTGVQVLSGKDRNATAVAVETTSVILQSVEGAQVKVSAGDRDLDPVLLSPTVCSNVVLQVAYVVRYNPAGEIVNVTASLVLGTVHGASLWLEQEFSATFVQENAEEVLVHYSGNPGYVVGLPLVAGSRAADGGMVQSADPEGALTVLQGAAQQDCLHGPQRRAPVLFGLDTSGGCTLRLEEAANCSLVSEALLGLLRGQNQPRLVASFGSAPTQNPLDWVHVTSNSKPGEAHGCSLPLSLHLEIQWTKYGSLINPQAQILSIREVITSNTSSLDVLSGGSAVISVSSSVAFVSVSAAAQPGLRAPPTIDAQLPYDFFFPFV